MLLKALSPNGKALDSDSSIFQVRILVALLSHDHPLNGWFVLGL